MPKQIKGNPRRTPPEPATGHGDVEAWIGQVMPGVQPIVHRLDEVIRDVLPGLHFGIKYRRAFYGLPDLGWVIELAPYFVSVNVVFHGGADFTVPPPLGDVGRSRYVKIRTSDEASSPTLIALLEQAGQTRGWT